MRPSRIRWEEEEGEEHAPQLERFIDGKVVVHRTDPASDETLGPFSDHSDGFDFLLGDHVCSPEFLTCFRRVMMELSEAKPDTILLEAVVICAGKALEEFTGRRWLAEDVEWLVNFMFSEGDPFLNVLVAFRLVNKPLKNADQLLRRIAPYEGERRYLHPYGVLMPTAASADKLAVKWLIDHGIIRVDREEWERWNGDDLEAQLFEFSQTGLDAYAEAFSLLRADPKRRSETVKDAFMDTAIFIVLKQFNPPLGRRLSSLEAEKLASVLMKVTIQRWMLHAPNLSPNTLLKDVDETTLNNALREKTMVKDAQTSRFSRGVNQEWKDV
jgi:hypothetical protein